MLSLTEKIENEKKNILKFEKQIKSWASRVYKKSNITVTDRHTEGDRYSNLSVNYINEKRRDTRIQSFKYMISSSESLIIHYESLMYEEALKNAPKKVYSDSAIADLESLFLEPNLFDAEFK